VNITRHGQEAPKEDGGVHTLMAKKLSEESGEVHTLRQRKTEERR